MSLSVCLTGCLDMSPGKVNDPVGQMPIAPQAASPRVGKWLGGPEPASGKLRSGIATYFQALPEAPVAGQPFFVPIRLEDVEKDDAQMELLIRDVRMANPSEPKAWKLKKGLVSEVRVQLCVYNWWQ